MQNKRLLLLKIKLLKTLFSESGLWTTPNWPKTKNGNDVTTFLHDVNVNLFDLDLFLLSSLVTGPSLYHVNIITGSGIMTFFFYKGLTKNLEIRNTPIWVLSNNWRLGRVMGTKLGTNVSSKMLLNAGKFQGYSFYHFLGIKGKPTGWGVKLHLPHAPRLGLNKSFCNTTNVKKNQEIGYIFIMNQKYNEKNLTLYSNIK